MLNTCTERFGEEEEEFVCTHDGMSYAVLDSTSLSIVSHDNDRDVE